MNKMRYPGPALPHGLKWSDFPPFGFIGEPPEDVDVEYSQQVDSDGVIHESWVPKSTVPKHVLYELWEQRARKCYSMLQGNDMHYANRLGFGEQQQTKIIVEQKSLVVSVFKFAIIATLGMFILVLFLGIFQSL